MAKKMIVLEQCQITPANSEVEFSLPLVFLDMRCHSIPLNQNLHLFHFPNCSRTQFLETIVPHLKKSLSLALAHFLPFAGNIFHNTSLQKNLVLRYVPGDSISFTVSQSEADLHQLAANNPRVSADFYDLVPALPPATHTVSSSSSPVSAFQVTLFPGQGISIAHICSHVVVEFQTLTTFLQSWALISRKLMLSVVQDKITTRACLDEANLLPCYDRENFVRMTNQGLGSIYWDQVVSRSPSPVESPRPKPPGADRVRSTIVLKKEEIQKLKDFYSSRVSTFVVVCAFVWICSIKSETEAIADDELEAIFFPARCQGRTSDFQVPDNYFGNCLAPILVELKHGELKSKNGFVMAVEAIGKGIWERVYGGGKGILNGAEDWPKLKQLFRKRQLSVAGSPRFDIYDTDFGWGRPNKFESLNNEQGNRIILCSSRDFEGGLEIGVSKPQIQMEAFTSVFNQVLGDFVNSAASKL